MINCSTALRYCQKSLMRLEAFMIIEEVYVCGAKRNNQLAFRMNICFRD